MSKFDAIREGEDGTITEKVVVAILQELNGRKGYNYLWHDLDEEIQDEIFDALFNIVQPYLNNL